MRLLSLAPRKPPACRGGKLKRTSLGLAGGQWDSGVSPLCIPLQPWPVPRPFCGLLLAPQFPGPAAHSPSSTPVTMEAKLSSSRIMSAACLETSEPAMPMATPMSAFFRAGESFTPSPVTATIAPCRKGV